MRAIALFTAILCLSLVTLAGQESNPDSNEKDSLQIIEITAKNYEFIPSEIRVRKGARVQIRLRTADRAHGLALEIYPEGARADGHPGLIFAHRQDSAKVEHDRERVIEFVADRTGTYDFKCSVQCGLLGHGRMKGKLIVDE
jgi:cytochrome c oxidase subunit II